MKKRPDTNYKNKYFDNFVDVLMEIGDRATMEDLLVGILTIKELQELPLRLEIVKRLLKGESHHKIAEDLSVGVATVTRGSKELQEGRFKVLKERMTNIPPFYNQ